MTRSRRLLPLAVPTLAIALAAFGARLAGFAPADLPERLTDQEFWRLSEDLSEPDGSFQSDNLISNEMVFARIVPELVSRTTPGGVYLGVGPEQNFTYIAAIQARFVFITDIRRNNLHLHLMYKALFELSADRAEFVSRLFTKPRPAGLTASSSATELMNAYWDIVTEGEPVFAANLKAVQDHLTKTRALPLPASDLEGIARVYRAFYWYGPSITYGGNLALSATPARGTTYWDLMTQEHSYLSSEGRFTFLKDLQRRNLIVPVVGNFAGPKALRGEGAYLRDRGATVTAFYVSNVESYLRRGGLWPAFCANVASMPRTDASLFIRPNAAGMVVAGSGNVIGVTRGGTTTLSTTTLAGAQSALADVMRARLEQAPGFGLIPMAGEVQSCGASLAPSR